MPTRHNGQEGCGAEGSRNTPTRAEGIMPQRKRRAKVANPGPVKSRSKQAAKAKNKSNVEAAIRSLDQELGQRRRRYQQFVASIRDLPGLQRAEKWLEYAVGDAREDGDEEASVYFISRGHPELANIEEFIADWQRGAHSV